MSTFRTIKRPEYTGENRCWLCTVVNVLLLGIASIAVAVVSPPVAVAVAALGAAGIWLRGYLVPYTPEFAPRLVAVLPRDPFHDEPRAEAGSLADGLADDAAIDRSVDGEAVLATLVETGIVEVDEEADQLFLSRPFERRWHEEMADLAAASDRDLADATAAVVTEAADRSIVTSRGRTHVVLEGESGAATDETWLQRPVAVAEVAAVRALTDAGVPQEVRRLAAEPLCTFLETCPECEEELVEGAEHGCCGTPRSATRAPRTVLRCPSCRVQFALFE
ncbi:hypothetical protein [Natronococcus wangiae]|uniref:hypothetical protein n=1 Tax=Natronococcus wangiae TaxID=3068275 RepID=UPI00273D281C|nr:hypothetical protein [Natronococcus sp. AD5]